jgi:hypothetical protein
MAIIAPPRISVEIDGLGAEINARITAAVVTLRSPAMDDSAMIEIDDPAGVTALPRHDAGLRIAIADTEVFRGRIVQVSGEGTERGQTLQLIGAAQGSPPAADLPPHVFIWGQNLVTWNLTAELEQLRLPEPRGDATLDAGVLAVTVHPAVRPGMKVTVVGVRAPFDGGYVAETVTHTFNLGAGFSTSLRIRRL